MVTVVVGLLFVATIAFSLWLGLEGSTEGPTYEIHFEQSVAGLTKGAKVDLLGVSVGRVTQIRIEPANPRLIVVRFVLTENVPLRRGVTASIARSLLDGTAVISLQGGDRNAPALVARAGQPFAIVPANNGGGIGGDLDPSALVAQASSGIESLSSKLDPAGQRQIENQLAALARRSRSWEKEVGQATVAPRSGTVEAVGDRLARVGEGAEKLRLRVDSSHGELRRSLLRQTTGARRAAESIGKSVSAAQPAVRQLGEDAKEVTEGVSSLSGQVREISDVAKKIDHNGLRTSRLPDHHSRAVNR